MRIHWVNSCMLLNNFMSLRPAGTMSCLYHKLSESKRSGNEAVNKGQGYSSLNSAGYEVCMMNPSI